MLEEGVETADMNGFLLVFTILTVAAATTPGTPPAEQADSVEQFYQENVQNESTCLVFLNSEKDTCLGTLIHKQWVLTAAHCFLPFLEMEIAISDERFQKRMEGLRPMLIIPHPSFKQDSAEHDIVLIKLTRPLKLNDQVKLAALPSPTTNRMDDCAVFGWGWSWQNSEPKPDVKINQTVSCFPNEHCEASPIGKMPVKITENMFCAGLSLESKHTCKEVLAAPILCQNQLQGILSWSEGCVLRGDVGYYTKVSRYTDWIHRVISAY